MRLAFFFGRHDENISSCLHLFINISVRQNPVCLKSFYTLLHDKNMVQQSELFVF